MPEDTASVTNGRVVQIRYTLKDDAGELLDSTGEGDPLAYLHGAGQIVAGLEAALHGLAEGDKKQVIVSPEEGYGQRDNVPPQPVPLDVMPEGADLEVGMVLAAQGPDGNVVPVWVHKIEEDRIFLDGNHPLAGKTLHFDVEVVGIREPTREELEHGHAHGAGGHEGH